MFAYRYSFENLSNSIEFDFGDSLVITESYLNRTTSFKESSASICDSSGNLLAYSNGCYVAKADGSEITNSEGLSPGIMYDLQCLDNDGYNVAQNMLMLPDPTHDSIIHLFHIPLIKTPDNNFMLRNVLHSAVDLSANNGGGSTLFKNQIAVDDTMNIDGLHAVRHANGRDWWVEACKRLSNVYYVVLLSPNGLSVQHQQIGLPSLLDAGGQVVFSPDGTKLARFNAKNDLRLFDFDRCTGELSNPIFVSMPSSADDQLFSGCAWSADSRYLYAQENYIIYQFDLLAPDIAASQTISATWDPVARCPFTVEFGFMELGPDGRIYCRPLNGQHCMHRMNHPERAGLASEMQLSYYNFIYPYNNLSHFPNFRLGPVDGSVCDTLGLDNHPLAGWRYDHTGGLGVDFTSVSWYEPITWLWDFGDPAAGSGNFSSEHNPTHAFSAPGKYNVCLTVSNQYGSNTKCKDVWITTVGSTEHGSGQEEIVLYPDPAPGIVNWSGTTGPVMVRIFNALGTLLLEQRTADNYLNISGLPDGFYTLQLLAADQSLLANRKLLVAKY
ncbi:MAG: PKD domain-containing protein [Saprospiraceae bacterium]|nr:PKD domain-containing protein [Saprospiraceae bacterium]